MNIETLCGRCDRWVPAEGTELCLDCGTLICPACAGWHTEHRVAGDTYLTCRPHTDEEVARMVEGDE